MPRKVQRHRRRKQPYTPSRGVFAGRHFESRRSYRAALRARRREIPARADRVRQTPILTLQQANRLSPAEEDEWIRSLNVANDMRRYRRSLATAARAQGLPETVVLKYASPALTTDSRGRIRAKPHDTLLRIMPMWTPRGQVPVPTRDSRLASLIGRHNWAVRQFIEGRGQRALKSFEGKSIRVGRDTYVFVTDPLLLKRLHLRDTPEYEGYSRTI